MLINGINHEAILAARLLLATLFLIFGWRKLRDFSGTVSQMVQLGVPTPASFDKWAIANTKRLVNAASLPSDVEIAAGWDACMTSIGRPAAQKKIKALFELGFHQPGDAENHLGSYLGRLGR
jgi:uncharacterized membrane protein YphA (DoxX/SURF4 family)